MNIWALWQARWAATSAREQRLLLVALALVLGALLWLMGVAPALSTLRAAEAQRQLLDVQWQQMLRLQAQAKALQALPDRAAGAGRRTLETSLAPLGNTAQWNNVGERVTLTLKDTPAQALALWLTQVRQSTGSTPNEAHLKRNANGNWDGTLVLAPGAPPAR